MSNIKSKNQRPFDENGRRHGKWLIYYDNDNLIYHMNYIHGVLNGYHEGYHIDGTLWYHGYWNMGRRVGYWYDDSKKYFYLCLI